MLCIKIDGTLVYYIILSYDITSESDITPCIIIDKPLVVYRFSNVTQRYPFKC